MNVQPEQLVAVDQNKVMPRRLPAGQAEAIDRSTVIKFTFAGVEYCAYPGDTIASALTAAGVNVLSRSFKYHRPRGLLCAAGQCPNCLVQIGDEPNVRSCQRPVQEGMEVRPQNVWPSLKRDVLALNQAASRFMPVGFYYKTFIRPRFLWPTYEHVLRNAAGLGEVDETSTWGKFDKEYLYADVVVVGGGPAGISAALQAASQGARVQLFDENESLGGHLRFSAGQGQRLTELVDAVEQETGVEVFSSTAVLGWYQDNWLAATRGNRLFKIRAKALVVATGAYEMPLLFDDNDLPGVLLGSAVQRLLHLYGTVPGKQALIATANDDGWEVAAALHKAGIGIAAVVDERLRSAVSSAHLEVLEQQRLPLFFGHVIQAAHGSGKVDGASIAPVDADGVVDLARAQRLRCDFIAVSMGWTPAIGLMYMAQGKAAYDEVRAEMLPADLPAGLYVAGRANGTHKMAIQIDDGRLAGAQAAAFVGRGAAPQEEDAQRADEPVRTSARACVAGQKKRFLCYCEDVTDEDVATAVQEGYDSMELLKRYSTVSMGPCQGKMCSMNAIHLCARATARSVQQTGSTTSRPPAVPVSLGALAGQNMEPVQYSAVHHWHLEQGAQMMVAGQWLRPEHYGNPEQEIMAVRQRVGLIDVSTLGKLKLTGTGVPTLLERLYVNQWRKLAVGRVRYGIMCNDEGVMMDDGVCARMAESEWYMRTTTSGTTAVYEWIQWWVQSGWGADVHVRNVSESYAAFNLTGPQARAVLAKLTDVELDNEDFPYMHVRSGLVAGVFCRILRIGFTGEISYELHCPAGYGLHLWQVLMEAGGEFGIAPFGVEAQRVLRLEKGHIIVGQDTDALSDPLAANMAWAVKLNKKDFLGKFALERIEQEGPRQRLVGFKMARSGVVPDEGLQIVARNGQGKLDSIGWVTSCKHSPVLGQTIGLCWLPVEVAAQEGASFSIYMNEREEKAHVHHGPFYDAAGERQT